MRKRKAERHIREIASQLLMVPNCSAVISVNGKSTIVCLGGRVNVTFTRGRSHVYVSFDMDYRHRDPDVLAQAKVHYNNAVSAVAKRQMGFLERIPYTGPTTVATPVATPVPHLVPVAAAA